MPALPETSTAALAFHAPLIEEDDIQAVVEVLRSGWLTTGPKVNEFESAFAAAVGAQYAVAVNSGTAALHLALDAVGLEAGDEVILPTLTFAATAEVVTYFKAEPVLVDSSAPCWNIDPEAIERAVTSRTKAILPVHFAGQACNMDAIVEIANKFGLRVIEDAAHAFPAKYKRRTIGTIGDVTCFSTYANKTITTAGEGGLATTNQEDLASRMRRRRLHGISKDAEGSWRYEIVEAGYKYNLTDVAAAMGLVQLKKAERMWLHRCEIADRYRENLRALEAYELPAESPDGVHAWHLYVLLVNPRALRIDRDGLIQELKCCGIGTSVHFIPLHLHPYYANVWRYRGRLFPVATQYSERCLSLPIYPAMTNGDVDRVCDVLRELARRYAR